jgi:hypothetical protein
MFCGNFFQRVCVVGLLATLLAGGDALAQRGDRGRGGGGGEGRGRSGGDDGGSRSFSRGGGGGESRSFSRGGGESRSFSRGGGESRSFSRGDSGSSRSMPSRSFSGESSRSYRGDSGRSPQTFRSDGRSTREFRPSDSGGSRSFSQQFRGSDQGERSRQDFDRGSSDVQRRIGQGQSNQGGQPSQARRANEEQVRNFLQLPSDSSRRQATTRGDATEGRDSRGRTEDQRRVDVARRLQESNRDDVNRNVGDVTRGDRESRNFRGPDRNQDFDRDRDFNRDRDSDRDRNVADRGDRDGNNRDYQRWREGAGSRDRKDDHRDWSGRWRDGDRFDHAKHIRKHWHDRWRDHDDDDFDFPFVVGWWNGHRHWHGDHWNWWGDYAHRHHRPYYWWSFATAPLLSDWVSFGWNRPYYWDYGPGEYIYYDDGIVYVNGRWYQPAPVFYDRTVAIVEQAPDLTAEEAAQLQWLPLGVFAVTPDGAAQADVLVQLAVTKDGVIGGTASDQRSGVAYPIEGMVEKQTQRAVWSYNNEKNQRIVMETSIYNLTQSEATGLVHYGPDDFRVIQLVRLETPEAGSSPAAPGAVGELPAP